MFVIRLARASDLPAINAIYNHYVLTSTCTYQTVPTTQAERLEWFAEHGPAYPAIVAEDSSDPGIVLAWASLSRFHSRCGFRFTVENSVYVHASYHRQGLATILMKDLIARAAPAGHHAIIAGISADQEASIRLHQKLGFTQVARLKEVGWKFERWLDVVYYELLLHSVSARG